MAGKITDIAAEERARLAREAEDKRIDDMRRLLIEQMVAINKDAKAGKATPFTPADGAADRIIQGRASKPEVVEGAAGHTASMAALGFTPDKTDLAVNVVKDAAGQPDRSKETVIVLLGADAAHKGKPSSVSVYAQGMAERAKGANQHVVFLDINGMSPDQIKAAVRAQTAAIYGPNPADSKAKVHLTVAAHGGTDGGYLKTVRADGSTEMGDARIFGEVISNNPDIAGLEINNCHGEAALARIKGMPGLQGKYIFANTQAADSTDVGHVLKATEVAMDRNKSFLPKDRMAAYLEARKSDHRLTKAIINGEVQDVATLGGGNVTLGVDKAVAKAEEGRGKLDTADALAAAVKKYHERAPEPDRGDPVHLPAKVAVAAQASVVAR